MRRVQVRRALNACGNCGAPVRPAFRAPPPELAPDLDLRPGEPARSTLARWVATCPACGASAPDLAALVAPIANHADEVDPFLRWAAIANDRGEHPAAAEATLQAAWSADDAGDPARATALRRRAVLLWGDASDLQDALRLVDVCRRAGAFAEAAARCDALARQSLDEPSTAIVAFQRDRIAALDDGRHLMSSALRPPARRPHVSHVPARPRGLWQRIVGR